MAVGNFLGLSIVPTTTAKTVPKSIQPVSEVTPFVYVEQSANSSSFDVLKQFEANMATLEDMNGRLRFMMSEIKTLVR